MNIPKLYRKKPIEIEAVQWDGTAVGATTIIDWILESDGTATYECSDTDRCAKFGGDCPHWIAIRTLEGTMRASLSDWIIRGVAGEFYPCKSDVFAKTYEDILPGTDPHILAVVPKSKYDDVVRLADIAEESRADLVGMLAEAVDELEPALRDVQAVRSLISAATANGSDTVQVRNLRAALNKETS